jgi:hypothetical protein
LGTKLWETPSSNESGSPALQRYSRSGQDVRSTPRIVRRFSAAVLIAFAVVGFGVGDLIVSQIRSDALGNASFHAEFVSGIVSEALGRDSLNAPLHGSQLARFDKVIRKQALRSGVVRIKIWSSTGLVLYSDKARLIGARFEEEATSLQAVLADGSQSEVTDLTDDENVFERHFGSLFSTYVPVTPRGAAGPVAVAEFYQLKGPIDDKVRRAEIFTFAIVFGGLGLLFAILWPLLRRHAKTLMDRNQALLEKTAQMERASVQTIQMLNRLANAKDPYTGGHIER